tara:strand:+ start:5294 stop:6166 length:873 start_codon:yes stop_codon:yes gene_type:complete
MNVKNLVHKINKNFERSNLFFGHGTDNAHDEAMWLVFSMLKLSYDDIPMVFSEKVNDSDVLSILTIANKRINERVPLAYLLHQAFFAGHEFYVDERVLVPRSPLAELIKGKFLPWVRASNVYRIIDLGTGSGCIAIAMAHAFPEAKVHAVDISPGALEVASINIERHNLTERIELIKSDFFLNIEECKYDLIVSNPPYVNQDDIATMPNEYHHEPQLGLKAGNDGLNSVHKILHNASRFLTDNGILICEVGNSQQALEDAYPTLPFIWVEFSEGGAGVFLLHQHDLQGLE